MSLLLRLIEIHEKYHLITLTLLFFLLIYYFLYSVLLHLSPTSEALLNYPRICLKKCDSFYLWPALNLTYYNIKS